MGKASNRKWNNRALRDTDIFKWHSLKLQLDETLLAKLEAIDIPMSLKVRDWFRKHG